MKRLISVGAITIPSGRQRKEFDEAANQGLQASIKAVGLLQAPVLEYSDGLYILRAGERRFRAIQDIYDLGGTFSYDGEPVPSGMVPHTLWNELTEIQRLEVEVDENNQREAFTWQEKAAATAKLMQLRGLQAKEAGLPPPTVADIALEVRGSAAGDYQANTRKEGILAKHLDNPEIANAPSIREAFKKLVRLEKHQKNAERAATAGRTFTAADHVLLQCDSLEWMKEQPEEQYAIILTDPPYGMRADEFGDSGKAGGVEKGHFYDDSYENWRILITVFAVESFRLATPDAHCYAFCDLDNFHAFKTLMTLAGWKVFRTPFIWNNPSKYRAPWPEMGPQRKYETILYAVKGHKPVNHLAPDVITVSADANLGHPAQKPVELFTNLLKRSYVPGDKVLDPFCGSGPVFPAAPSLGCPAVGLEQEPMAFGIAVERLENLK